MNISKVKESARGLLDLVYPSNLYCISCDKIIDTSRPYSLCNDCMDSIKWITERSCTKCGKALSKVNPKSICYSCSEHSHIYRKGYSCAEYGMHERSILYKLKYHHDTAVAPKLGEAIYDMLTARQAPSYDVIIPVPSHQAKKLERGYNQAELIASEVAIRLNTKLLSDVIVRTSETKALRSKTPDERKRELQGAFALSERYKGELCGLDVLIIDDIYTTGATIDAVSKVAFEGKARFVDFASFASGADVVKC